MTPARYCPKCGSKNLFVDCKEEFHPDTGEKITLVNVRCPKMAFWNKGHYIEIIAGVFESVKIEREKDSPHLDWWTKGEGSK